MSDDGSKIEETAKKTAEPPKKKRRWLKVLLILFSLFCLLIVGIYFYISSAAFVRGQVFTRVEQHLQQPVSSEEISFSPLSGLELKKFTLGEDPFLKADTIRVYYDLISIINGKVIVSEMTLENAELNVIINRDGKLNILSKVVEKIEVKKEKPEENNKAPKEKETAQSKKAATPPEVNIKNINIKNLKLHVFRDSSDEEKILDFNLENLSFSLPEIANGKDLNFELETAINCKAGEKFNLKNGLIKVSGKSKLSAELVPELIGMDIKISSLDAVNESVNLPLKALNILADIGIDGKKVNIKTFNIENPEKKSGVSVSGLIDNNNIDLNLTISKVDSSILDLALLPLSGSKPVIRWQEALTQVSGGKVAGFGSTIVNFEGSVKGDPDSSIEAGGKLSINSLPLVQISTESSVVPITTKVDYLINANKKENIVELKKLSINVSDEKSQLVGLNLNSPLKLDTKNNKLTSDKDDRVTFKLNRFDLNLLKAFMKETKRNGYEKGFISTDIELVSRDGGNELQLNLNHLSLNDLSVKKDDEQVANINLTTSSKLSLNDLTNVNLQDLNFSVKQGGNELVSLQASGLINLDKVIADITLSSLKVQPHIGSFVPAKINEEIGLKNINLSSDKLLVHYSKGGISAEGRTFIRNLGLNGSKIPTPTVISSSTAFKVSIDESETLTIENFAFDLLTDGKRALQTTLSGMQNGKLGVVSVQFKDLMLQPGLSSLLPVELKNKFGLENINLDSKDLKIDIVKDKIAVKGSLFSNGISLGGDQFKDKFSLSQSTTLDIQLVKDQLVDIKALNLSLQTDNNKALSFNAQGTFRPGDKSLIMDLSQLEISPGLRKVIPAALLNKFGLQNLNGKSQSIKVSFAEGSAGFVKADFTVADLGIAGTQFKPFTVSQSLNVDVAIDRQGLVKIGQFHSKTTPSIAREIEVFAKGQVDLNFQRDDSEISIDIPSSIDLDALLAVMKKQEVQPDQPVKTIPKTVKPEEAPTQGNKQEAAPKKAIKMTVKTSVNEVLFDKQSIKGIRALAYINGDNYTLKEAVMQVGDSILKASGQMANGVDKSLNMNVSSSGPIDLSPLNDILNKGTGKQLSGKVTIQKLNAVSSGKNNEEITNNLKAAGKIYIQDLHLKNYAASGGLDFALDNILGVNPANIEFQQGLMDISMDSGILTLNQMDFNGSSIGFNPRGTIDLKNNTYDIHLKTAAGFGGGKWIQEILSKPALVNLINSKTDELKKFQEKFPYDNAKKKFMLKEDYLFNKEVRLTNTDQPQTLLESMAGLNHVAAEMLTSFFVDVAQKSQMKEAASVVNLLKGNISTDSILDIGKSLLEKELNKKKDKENMDDKKSSDDPVKSILDILGGGKKKKEKKEEPKKVEEQKKEEPINKEDELIKKIQNIIK